MIVRTLGYIRQKKALPVKTGIRGVFSNIFQNGMCKASFSERLLFCSTQRRNIFSFPVPVVLSKNRIDQSHMEFSIGFYVSPAYPSVIIFHADHVLLEDDADQAIDPLIRVRPEKAPFFRRRPSAYGQIFLHEYIRGFSRGRVVSGKASIM